MDCSTPGFPVLHYLPDLLRFMFIESGMLSNLSSAAAPFSCCLQSFPASRSFPLSQLFTSGGLSVGASASASVLLMNIQGWFPLVLTGLISLQPKDFQESSPALQFKSINFPALGHSLWSSLTSVLDDWETTASLTWFLTRSTTLGFFKTLEYKGLIELSYRRG